MFRLQRVNNKTSKSGERIDFKFSNFQALQVPKGWDKLFVSIISAETGKTTAKSGKATVRNGSCQWSETLSGSVLMSQDETSKESQGCTFKILVSMGSARSAFLGEATVNMVQYASSKASSLVSLPLKKCNHGTILQLKIQCLNSRTKLRDEESATSQFQGNQDQNSTLHQVKTDDSRTNYSRSSSVDSSGSKDNSGRKSFSLKSDLNTDNSNLDGRQYGVISENSSTTQYSSVDDLSISSHSSFNSRVVGLEDNVQNNAEEMEQSSLSNASSSKNLLEAAEGTIEELQKESEKWKREAQKLALDLDNLKKEFHSETKLVELSAAQEECHGLKKEIEQLKIMLEEKTGQVGAGEVTLQSDDVLDIHKEWESEIKYQRETNANLAVQLERSQESNIELVSVLQELEETIEKQKAEIDKLMTQKFKNCDMEESKEKESEISLQPKIQLFEQALEEKTKDLEKEQDAKCHSISDIEEEFKSKISVNEEQIARLETKLSSEIESNMKLTRDMEVLRDKLQELERDCSELTDENLDLLLKLKDLDKGRTTGVAFDICDLPSLPGFSESKTNEYKLEMPVQFSELLKQLELCFHHVRVPCYNISSDVKKDQYDLNNLVNLSQKDKVTLDVLIESVSYTVAKLNKLLQIRIAKCEEVLEDEQLKIKEKNDIIEANLRKLEAYDLKVLELESSKLELEVMHTGLRQEMDEKRSMEEKLEAQLLSKDQEIDNLQKRIRELEAEVFDLQKSSSKCLANLNDDLKSLKSSLDLHVWDEEILEKKSEEMESGTCELENRILELEEQGKQLSEQISCLRAQLRYVMDERESNLLELESSKSTAMFLEDEVTRLAIELGTQSTFLLLKLQDVQNQQSLTLADCERLRVGYQKLQASSEDVIKEKNALQKSIRKLKGQNLDLQDKYLHLESELHESQKCSFDYSEKIQALEDNITSKLESVSSTEKIVASELDMLFEQNRKLKEKIDAEESLLNKIYSERAGEIESLRSELDRLLNQLSETCDEKERILSETAYELSGLRNDKAMLESALKEVQSKVISTHEELDVIRIESELKVRDLMRELDASKQSHELLIADHSKSMNLLASYQTSEEKLRTAMNNLELQLTVSECERQQFMEEIGILSGKLEEVASLQNEVLVLTSKLEECKFEKGKLETALLNTSADNNELKAEKIFLVEKISWFEKAISELEECKHRNLVLEEKIRQMEGDKKEKEALHVQQAELINEIREIKKVNMQYEQKIHFLEEESKKYVIRASNTEECQKLMTTKLVDGEKKQMQASSKSGKALDTLVDLHQVEGDEKKTEKIQELENELARALEANNKYKVQLQRFLSEGTKATAARKSVAGSEVYEKEKYERSKSSLEVELRDLRERYFHMSLKYAEVESEREDLVMKLKNVKSGKRWFS